MQFRFWMGGYIVMIHAFIEGFRFGPDAAWIEIKSLFFRLVILVWTVDLAEFKIQMCRIFLHYHFSFHALIFLIIHFTRCMF